jgi:hypothetical protein
MSMSVLASPIPGWYADPAGIAAYRWWDGDTWTEGTHDGLAQPQLAEPSPSHAEPSPSFAEPVPLFAEPAPLFAEPVAPVAQPVAGPAAQSPAQPQPVAPRRSAPPAKTRWSSLLVAFPFVFPVVIGMIVALAYAGGAAGNLVTLAIIGGIAAFAMIAVAFMFADYDRRELRERGYEPAPSLAWMLLLPPVAYLLARRRLVGPRY